MKNFVNQILNLGYRDANTIIREVSGIVDFFASDNDKTEFISTHGIDDNIVREDRVAYGDWQTPLSLAEKVCENHVLKYGEPDIVVEPTCGIGAFVIAALQRFSNLSEIHAIEINKQYVDELKTKLLSNALRTRTIKHPDIYIYNSDIFGFNFTPIIQKCALNKWNLALIGNPPWVTNSSQGRNSSNNLPVKKNYFGLKGIDAIMGRSNFDISEYITLHLLRLSQTNAGGISFLLKNSVIRSILSKQHTESLRIGDIEQQPIDASSEFNVSVDASCFSARFNCMPSFTCRVKDFYSDKFIKEFGWVGESFVADNRLYNNYSRYDNTSTYIWRSGIKHDCASVLELTKCNGAFVNGFGEIVKIEDDMVYPLLKSSDIRKYQTDSIRKFIIVPQHKVGEDTSLLAQSHPLTYLYLTGHEAAFSNRKSSIYHGKDKFSIFGVGDYSFSKYKIVISSLYKDITFVLVSESEGKPVLVDDTCYQLDFDNYEEAKIIYDALNSNEIQSLLHSIVFKDAKRVVTKNLLMRLDIALLCKDKGIVINTQRFINSSQKQLSLFD